MRSISLALALIFGGTLYGQAIDDPITQMQQIDSMATIPGQQKHYLTGFTNPEFYNPWKMVKKRPHHNAIVRVVTPHGAGSGAIVALEEGSKGMVVITNHHVVETHHGGPVAKIAEVRVQKGTSGKMYVIASSPQMDLAVLWHPEGSAADAMPIAGYDVPMGATVEMAGFGGPTSELRPFEAKRISHEFARFAINAPTISGDSGCPMMHDGNICAVNFGSVNGRSLGSVPDQGGPWTLHYPACSNVDGQQIARYLTQICGPRGCTPRIIYRPGQIANPGNISLNPPDNGPGVSQPDCPDGQCVPRRPIARKPCPCNPRQPASGCECDTQKIIDDVLSQIPRPSNGVDGKDGQDGQSITGPVGPQRPAGPQGDPGRTPTEEEIAAIIEKKLAEMGSQYMRRVVIVDGSKGEILDDETYGPDEPIVFDVQSIRRQLELQ